MAKFSHTYESVLCRLLCVLVFVMQKYVLIK